VPSTIQNCIIWKNADDLYWTNQSNWYHPTYSCFTDGNDIDSGTGNIYGDTNDPNFVDVNAGDFHIKFDSPCRNAGDPNLSYTGETDIDGQNRINGSKRVDIGADEYYGNGDFNDDGIVNFVDYVIFAKAWRTQPGNPNWNAACDLIDDNNIDINDLDLFCDNWLWIAPGSPLNELLANQSDSGSMVTQSLPEPVALVDQMPASAVIEEPAENQQPSMLEDESEAAAVWLVYDGNMMPNYGDEITVSIHSDANLFMMEAIVTVSGDANITSAMNESDCNNFGWDNGWDSNPYIDPTGWVEIFGLSLESFFNGTDLNGTVGYLKFRYYGGQVSVSITADSTIYDSTAQDRKSVV
jgi:hypothetical protein